MEKKKSAKADLENRKFLSLLMGCVVGLAVLFVGFEWGTQEIQILKEIGVADIFVEDDIEFTVPPESPPPPPPPPPAPAIIEEFIIVENDVELEDLEFLPSEDDQTSEQINHYLGGVPGGTGTYVEEEDLNQLFIIVEEMPEFPGGDQALLGFINKTVKYPVIAQENDIQGRVVCTFTVNTDGSIVDAEVVRGIDPSLDKEALRVISRMPKWKPGKQRGKPVRVRYTLPIVFRLQ